jgi:hypothetical protein
MSSNYEFESDVKEALAMAENLETYVRGDELYGSTGGSFFSRMPSLTIGALLMRLRRLDRLRDHLSDHQKKRLDSAIDYHNNVRSEWAHHNEEKLQKEAHSRIDAMSNFFRECHDSPAQCDNVYLPELLRRTIVQEVLDEMGNASNDDKLLTDKIRMADTKLHEFVRPDSFQWDSILQPVYPESKYWWLYQKPPQTGR